MRSLATLALLSTLAHAPLAIAQPAESDGPTFDVATVRENTSGEARTRIEVVNARFNAINMTLRELVSIAYPTDGGRFRHANQLVGGPGWFTTARFDIVARADGFRGDTNRPAFTASAADREAVERVRLMLQHLLAERFKLRVRQETRELPTYELVVLKRQRRARSRSRSARRRTAWRSGRSRGCPMRATWRADRSKAIPASGR